MDPKKPHAPKKHEEPAVSAPAATAPDHPPFVADAGAAFQKDRSGDPRGREISEGAANFAAFSATIRAAAKPEEAE